MTKNKINITTQMRKNKEKESNENIDVYKSSG